MIIFWFWTGLVSSVFALSAYNQASEPGWKIAAFALSFFSLAMVYLYVALPDDLSVSVVDFARHPDGLKWKAAGYVAVTALLVAIGALVGRVLGKWTSPARIGGYAFVCAFVGLHLVVFGLAAA